MTGRIGSAASLLMALAACGSGAGEETSAGGSQAQGNAAVPLLADASAPGGGEGRAREKVLKSETVEAVFTGWEMGDYVWANLEVKGRDTAGAWVGPTPLEHFLEAHKGKPITARIDTVIAEIPEAGGATEVAKIADARLGTLTAAAWWQGLSASERQVAERRMEEVLAGAGG